MRWVRGHHRCQRSSCPSWDPGTFTSLPPRRLQWPGGMALVSAATDQHSNPDFPVTASLAEWLRRPPRERKGFFRGRVIQVTSELALQWLPCLTPGVIGSALGPVGPVSIYCDWVRWKV